MTVHAGGGRSLSIVIPAYNEAARLPASLEKIAAYLREGETGRTEVVVVDDGSADATADRATETAAHLGLDLRVVRLPENRGKGAAVRIGVLGADGAWVLITDADLSTPISEWKKLAGAGTEVAIGSRALDESLLKEPQPFFRQASGKLFNRMVQLLVIGGIRDTQCGFKLFRQDAAKAVFSRGVEDRFAFDVEALAIARILGYRITEVPVLWFNSPDTRVGLLAGMKAFWDLLRIGRRTRRLARAEKEKAAG